MRPLYAACIVMLIVVLLTVLSCSTRESSKYWHNNKTSLFNMVDDANVNLSKANTSGADRNTRLRYATASKSYLASARNMATDQAIAEILGVDAPKMKHEIDKTYARILGTEPKKPRCKRKKNRKFRW